MVNFLRISNSLYLIFSLNNSLQNDKECIRAPTNTRFPFSPGVNAFCRFFDDQKLIFKGGENYSTLV